MKNKTEHECKMNKKIMTEERKQQLIKQYQIYSKIDWAIVFAILIVVFEPALRYAISLLGYEILGIGTTPEIYTFVRGEAGLLGNSMALLYSIPLVIYIPFFIICTVYNIWSTWLFVKVWSIKEIPKRFLYWLDWFLLFVLTVYDVLLFYSLLVRL